MNHMADESIAAKSFHDRITALGTAMETRKAYVTGIVATVSAVSVVIQVIVSVAMSGSV